ncbi:hypothetical protein OA177_01860, partial [Candidatus Pelagibacter sp.]|nr:hypothetical protein [Candidatus Pelagibacter sp.]
MLPNSEKDFLKRHIGPSKEDQSKMLKELNYKSLDDLIDNTVPEKIKFKGELNIGESNSEYEALRKLRVMSKNQVYSNFIGMGYYGTYTPYVILRNILENPGWYTVKNRSRSYVNKIISKISGEHFKNYKITKIKRKSNGLDLYYGGENEFFDYDKVILATHADEALKLIENPTEDEKNILSNFSYKENVVYIHTDQRAMPKNKNAWCSWNSSIDNKDPKKNSITYWLNLLQNLKCDENIFLTLNPYFEIDKKKVLKKVTFTHPYYDQKALDAQSELIKLQNQKDLLFCGSYFGYGFHEDG